MPSSSEETNKRQTYFSKFKKILNDKANSKVAIFSHRCPDPDALGSMMGLKWLLEKSYGLEADLYFDGRISHPQNMAFVNLLDPGCLPVSQYIPNDYQINILVDTVPVNAGTGEHQVDFDLVIDHHKEIPNGGFKGLFINLKAGSCCSTIYYLIMKHDLKFEDGNDIDSKVATGLMIGITTDTENLSSDDTTEYEFEAWKNLFEYRDPIALKQIIHFQRPKIWRDSKADAVKRVMIDDGIGIVGLGVLSGKHRDLISDMASEMITWEDVQLAICFAIVDGNTLEASVRSTNPSISVPDICKQLATKYGAGGGKSFAGAYRYDLGGNGIDPEDGEDVQQEIWLALNKKETRRILRTVGT